MGLCRTLSKEYINTTVYVLYMENASSTNQ